MGFRPWARDYACAYRVIAANAQLSEHVMVQVPAVGKQCWNSLLRSPTIAIGHNYTSVGLIKEGPGLKS